MEMAELSVIQQISDSKTQVPLLDRLWQSQNRAERAYAQAQRELQRLQYSRSQTLAGRRRASTPQPSAPQPVPAVPFVMSPVAAAPCRIRICPMLLPRPRTCAGCWKAVPFEPGRI